jgi:hypothetical protein
MSQDVSIALVILSAIAAASTLSLIRFARQLLLEQRHERLPYTKVLAGEESLRHNGAERVIVTIQFKDGSQAVVVDRAAPNKRAQREAVETALEHLASA